MKKLVLIFYTVAFFYGCKNTSINVDSTQQVEKSINELLSADYTKLGFIIIEGKKDLEYVQFGAEHYGLMLMWPYVDNKYKGISEINRVKLYLNNEKYIIKTNVPVTRESVLSLKKKEYIQGSDGLYVNVGNDAKEITELVKYLFKNIYEYKDFNNMKIELVLDNS